MRVIILGAGASKAYTESVTKVRMPVAKDFFDTYRQLSISENTWVLIGALINYLRDYHNVSIEEFGRLKMDIEQLHSDIDESGFPIITSWYNRNINQILKLRLAL